MIRTKLISEGENYTAVNIGGLDNLSDYAYLHPKLKTEVRGKVFLGEVIHSSAVEISFQQLFPGQEIPFRHKHRDHEEVYVIIKGEGQFLIDNDCIDVNEGSVIRIAPVGSRSWRNNSDKPITVMCIQAKQNSLESRNIIDGYRVE